MAERLAPGLLRPAGLAALNQLAITLRAPGDPTCLRGASSTRRLGAGPHRGAGTPRRRRFRERLPAQRGAGGVHADVPAGSFPTSSSNTTPADPHQALPEPGSSSGNETTSNPLAVRGMPAETFAFTIAMDADDEPDGSPPTAAIAEASGVTAAWRRSRCCSTPGCEQQRLVERSPRRSSPGSAATTRHDSERAAIGHAGDALHLGRGGSCRCA